MTTTVQQQAFGPPSWDTAAADRRMPQATAAPGDRGGDSAIRRTTVGAVVTVALIAAFVSYRHVRAVALGHGEDPINATVIPISVDGLIVAASLTMLADSRAGRRRHWLSYALLVLGSAASLAANVMHAEPTLPARIIAAWPSASLIGSYELLMRQIRATTSPAALVSAPVAPDGAVGVALPARTGAPSPPPTAADDAPTGPAGGAAAGRWVPTKKERLRLLLAEQVTPDDPRTIYALARDLGPQIGLHPGTARRYLPDLIAERRAVTSHTRRPPDPGPG